MPKHALFSQALHKPERPKYAKDFNDGIACSPDYKLYMSFMLAHELPSSPGSHFAIVDSGTPVHIVFDHLFVTNTREDHTAVSGFSGTTSRATHRGDLSFRAHSYDNEAQHNAYIRPIRHS